MFDEILANALEMVLDMVMSVSGIAPGLLKISNEALEVINPIWSELCILGLGLTIVFFIIELNKIYAFEGHDMNMKSLIKPFLKLGCAVIALIFGARIIGVFLGWHNSFIDLIDGSLRVYHPYMDFQDPSGNRITPAVLATDMIENMGLGTKFVAIFLLCIAWFVSAVVSFIWDFKAYGYQFELLYRVGITPLALADIYSGQNANAIKWMKGFLGLALYGISFIVIPRLGVIISVDQLQNAVTNLTQTGGAVNVLAIVSSIIGILIIPIAELGIMGTVKQVCKEVLQ